MSTTPRAPAFAERRVRAYLQRADRIIPGGVIGCYLYGSAALGGFRAGASDLDVLIVLDDAVHVPLASLRRLHRGEIAPALARLARFGKVWAVCNVSFVKASQLPCPVTQIEAVASHVGHEFVDGAAFDVNPVMWNVLQRRGIALRGPDATALRLDPEPARLIAWNLQNLSDYWEPLGRAAAGKWLTRKSVQWAVLGVARLHHTIRTGDVVSKTDAGLSALAHFGAHRPLIRDALAHLKGRRPIGGAPRRAARGEAISMFIADAIAAARDHGLRDRADEY